MIEKGSTIAVLGAGFNHIYPEENINLVKEIIKNGGVIISEYPPNTEVNLSNFPIRNRIIAGIASSTIVVEAKARSGSSVTARHSIIQGKKVYCVPGRIGDKNGRGTNNLIKKGAHILTDVNQILSELGEEIKIQEIKEYGVGTKLVNNIKEEYKDFSPKHKQQIENKKGRKEIKNKKIKIQKEYSKIYELVSESAMNVNELARALNIDISELNMKITIMEIEGLIEVFPGNMIKIKEN